MARNRPPINDDVVDTSRPTWHILYRTKEKGDHRTTAIFVGKAKKNRKGQNRTESDITKQKTHRSKLLMMVAGGVMTMGDLNTSSAVVLLLLV